MKNIKKTQVVNDRAESTFAYTKTDPIGSKQCLPETVEGMSVLKINHVFNGLRHLKNVNQELHQKVLDILGQMKVRQMMREIKERNDEIDKQVYLQDKNKYKMKKKKQLEKEVKFNSIILWETEKQMDIALHKQSDTNKRKLMGEQRTKIRDIVKGNVDIDKETKQNIFTALQNTINGQKQDIFLLEYSFKQYIECTNKNNYSYFKELKFDRKETIRITLHDHKLVKYNCNRNIQCTSEKCLRQYKGCEWWKCMKGCDVNI
eukprot:180131_1